MINTDGEFTDVNKACSELFGHTKFEMLRKSIFEAAIDSQKLTIRKAFNSTMTYGSVEDIETLCKHKNGNHIPVSISMQLLPDEKSIVVVINSLEDKRRLQQLNKKLKTKVKKEVAKNTRIQQIAYNEKIQNARLSSIGRLAAGVTHEINTPLTYIKGNLEMMEEDINDTQFDIKESLLNDIKLIHSGIARIENIIQSMREVSSDNPNEEKQATNIFETILIALNLGHKRVEQTVRLTINDKPFEPDIPKNHITLISNVQRQKIEQVWIIIINNALDALESIEDYDKRAFSINISSEFDQIIILFKDNAGGITEEHLEKIFDPFVTTKSHKGMGIGLNIAKKIIENQNGTIEAYNQDNGAVFEVRLPLLKS